jgi:predicted NBD/HSP70 family sugar kinase
MLIGVDIGGTSAKFGVLSDDYKLLEERSIKTDTDYAKGISNIAEIINEYKRKYEFKFVGIGINGVVDPVAGELVLSFNLPDWSGKKLADDLSALIKLPVKIENDAVCAAVAEIVLGTGKKVDELICLIWGTGVGGAMIKRVDHKLIVFPVEIGSQIIEWDGKLVGHGPRGRLSSYVGGGSFKAAYGVGPEKLSADDTVWNIVSQRMAQGVINTLAHFKSDAVIFSGGFINKQEHLLVKIRKCIADRLAINKVPELKLSLYGEKGGVYGAAILPLQNLSR